MIPSSIMQDFFTKLNIENTKKDSLFKNLFYVYLL